MEEITAQSGVISWNDVKMRSTDTENRTHSWELIWHKCLNDTAKKPKVKMNNNLSKNKNKFTRKGTINTLGEENKVKCRTTTSKIRETNNGWYKEISIFNTSTASILTIKDRSHRFLMIVILRWVNYRPDEGKLKDILVVQIHSSWQNLVMFMLEYLPN